MTSDDAIQKAIWCANTRNYGSEEKEANAALANAWVKIAEFLRDGERDE